VKIIAIFFVTLAITLVLDTDHAKGQSEESHNTAHGKRLWLKYNCFACHGTDGHGGGAGPKIAPHPIALAAFVAIVRHPRQSNMPMFSSKLLPDEDLRDIWIYMKTIPENPLPASIPLLEDR